MTDQLVTDPNDRSPEAIASPLSTATLEARNQHLLDIYKALGVEWNGDPFTRINYLRASSTEVETKDAFIEDILAELGIAEQLRQAGLTPSSEAGGMTIARRIRGLIKAAESSEKPPRQLYDSIPLFGYELITRERIRQITQERYSEAHDDEHTDHSLAIVAAIYAVADIEGVRVMRSVPADSEMHAHWIPAWPTSWDQEHDKRAEHPRLRQLSIAGALIAAEIDRLQRTADEYERHERETIATELEIDRRNDL